MNVDAAESIDALFPQKSVVTVDDVVTTHAPDVEDRAVHVAVAAPSNPSRAVPIIVSPTSLSVATVGTSNSEAPVSGSFVQKSGILSHSVVTVH